MKRAALFIALLSTFLLSQENSNNKFENLSKTNADWEQLNHPVSGAGYCYASWATDLNTLYLCNGSRADIHKSTDGGSNWNTYTLENSEGVLGGIMDIFFISPENGYLVTSDNYFAKTTDAGVNWDTLSLSSVGVNNCSSVQFTNLLTGYILTQTQIVKTTDGGDSWSVIKDNFSSIILTGLYFTDSDNGYICGFNPEGEIHKTTDGGDTWATATYSPTPIYSIHFYDANNGVACGEFGTLLKTTNAGADWIDCSKPGEGRDLNKIKYIANGEIFCCGYDGAALLSLNNGLSWSNESFADETDVFFTFANFGEQVWAIKDQDFLFKNTSPLPVELNSFSANVNGSSVELVWQTVSEHNNYGFEVERRMGTGDRKMEWEVLGFIAGAGNSNSPKEYSFSDNNLTLTSYSYSYRLKQIDLDGKFTYSKEISVEQLLLPTEFSLSQNYPNPFNPSTVIKYQLPMNGFVSLKIYDILGSEIATLVSEQKPAGTYEVKFDASALTSGVYVYRLSSSSEAGDFSQAKKLTLIK
ncbi:MAG: T9SS type A sorting domain-containing protein [Ignavibacteria bacterium]|nr:T9SS type A sorting domain-containing protein [Ignavibacteria bacterium]